MNTPESVSHANLDFFVSELWANVDRSSLFLPLKSELARWLLLGAGIGFFDKTEVDKFLLRQQVNWQEAHVLDLDVGYGVELTFFNSFDVRIKMFVANDLVIEDARSDLHAIFRNYMLMNSEILADRDAMGFLATLHTTGDIWRLIVNGGELLPDTSHSVKKLCSGLAKALGYLEHVLAIKGKIPSEMSESRDFDLSLRNELIEMLQEFQSYRLGLAGVESTLRYFDVAGSVFAQCELVIVDDFDPRREIFVELYNLLDRWPDPSNSRAELPRERCWSRYVRQQDELPPTATSRMGHG
jgi:hypothetical protein